jgi:transcriptional regulator with XRE-family HTH domain
MINAAQIRAARALLNWNQSQLAENSNVARGTIKNIENGDTAPRRDTAAAIQEAFENFGVEFLPGSGVCIRETSIQFLQGDDGISQMWDDIYHTCLKEKTDDIMIFGIREIEPSRGELYEILLKHIDRLEKAGIRERILIEEGDYNYVNEWNSYRWLPKDNFNTAPILCYADKIAIFIWDEPSQATIIHNVQYAKSFRALFNFAWDRAIVPPMKGGKK